MARLRRNLVDRDPSTPFFVFDSSKVAVALNLDHLLHYYELWDALTPSDWHDPKVSSEEVSVYFSDSPEPLCFDVDVDPGVPGEEDDEGQLRLLLLGLDLSVEPGEFVSFMDIDGEHAFFRASDIAVLTIPLRNLDERLNNALHEGEEVSEEAEDPSVE